MAKNMTLGGNYIVWFKKDNPKGKIDKMKCKARDLDNISLENEIKTKKYYLSKAKINNKYNASVLITIIIACITISISWVTLHGNITNSTIQASKVSNEYREKMEEKDNEQNEENNKGEKSEAEVYEEQINAIVEMLEDNVSLGLRAIRVGALFIVFAMVLFIGDVWSGSREAKNIASLELELDILIEERDKRKEIMASISM
jgi:hypothetical protein